MTVRAKLFATKAHFRLLKTKDDVAVGKENEIGKAPVNRSTLDYKPGRKELVEHPGKLGIHPGTVGILVIDVDPKKGGQLPSLIDEVEKLYGTPIRQIDTPGIGNNKFPGVHMLYKKADGPVNRTQWEHGDIRADNGYAAMHGEALWLEAIKLAPREKAIDIDLLQNAKADGLLNGAHTKEEIIAVLKTVEEGRHPTMVSAACNLHSMDCLSDKVIDELHTIWLKQGKPDRAVNDEFPSIIRFAKKTEIKVRRLVTVSAEDVKVKRARWVWEGWIPQKAITLIVGIEGLGKSTYALHLAARLTRGQLKGDFYEKPVGVSIYAAEDNRNFILKPRLLAAGANMKKIRFIKGMQTGDGGLEAVSIEKDIAAIKTSILENDTKVLIIDPMIAWLDAKRDSNDYRDVQVVLGAIDALLADVGASCVGITHFNKSTGPLENRIMGSRGWSARVRSQISIVPDDGDDRIVGHLKCNYGPLQESLKFGILVKTVAEDADDGSPVKASLIEERGASELTARDAMVAADNRHLKAVENPKDRATAWLIKFFDGKTKYIPRKTIIEAAEKEGHKQSTVYRASKDLDVKIKKDGRETLWAFSEL